MKYAWMIFLPRSRGELERLRGGDRAWRKDGLAGSAVCRMKFVPEARPR